MKVRNLLLAGLAIVAMAGCSNEEVTDNGQEQGNKNASMQVSFSFPQGTTGVREVDKGSEAEYDFQHVDILLKYANGTTEVVSFVKNDFDINDGNNSTQVLTAKASKQVSAGTAEVYAFLNLPAEMRGNNLKTANLETLVMNATSSVTSLDYIADGIAKENNFLMSNTDGIAISKTFPENKVTDVTIPVERTAAKIEEKTSKEGYTWTFEKNATEVKGSKMDITLKKYSLGNLALSTYVVDKNANVTNPTFFQTHQIINNEYTYTDAASYKYKDMKTTTYCMENYATAGFTGLSTYVVYEAEVKLDDATNATTFYVYNDKIYKSIAELKGDYPTFNYSDATPPTQAQAEALGVSKYVDGKCYYMKEIKTGNESKVIRNNWYILNVNSLSGLGWPEPKKPEDPKTMMNLTIEIQPWTVILNDIDF